MVEGLEEKSDTRRGSAAWYIYLKMPRQRVVRSVAVFETGDNPTIVILIVAHVSRPDLLGLGSIARGAALEGGNFSEDSLSSYV